MFVLPDGQGKKRFFASGSLITQGSKRPYAAYGRPALRPSINREQVREQTGEQNTKRVSTGGSIQRTRRRTVRSAYGTMIWLKTGPAAISGRTSYAGTSLPQLFSPLVRLNGLIRYFKGGTQLGIQVPLARFLLAAPVRIYFDVLGLLVLSPRRRKQTAV